MAARKTVGKAATPAQSDEDKLKELIWKRYRLTLPLPEWTAEERDKFLASSKLGDLALSEIIAIEQDAKVEAPLAPQKYTRPEWISAYRWRKVARPMRRALCAIQKQEEKKIPVNIRISVLEPSFGPVEADYAQSGFIKPTIAPKKIAKAVSAKKTRRVKA